MGHYFKIIGEGRFIYSFKEGKKFTLKILKNNILEKIMTLPIIFCQIHICVQLNKIAQTVCTTEDTIHKENNPTLVKVFWCGSRTNLTFFVSLMTMNTKLI